MKLRNEIIGDWFRSTQATLPTRAERRNVHGPVPMQIFKGIASFDHFVGEGVHKGRDAQTERLGGLQVDHQLILVLQLHG